MKFRLIAFSLPLFLLLLISCSKPGPVVSAKEDIDYYTCTMHPRVHSKKPGACPVCGMDLVPVNKIKPPSEQANQIPPIQSRWPNGSHTSSMFRRSASSGSASPTLK
jgi:hypothetical protein